MPIYVILNYRMIKTSTHKAGRPLKGDRKRIRVSFTLHPSQAVWLNQQAAKLHSSKSEILEKIITKSAGQLTHEVTHAPRIHIPVKKIEEFCTKHHVKKLSLFGSVLREDFGPHSDIDILIEFEEQHQPSLFELVPMEWELSKLFEGRKIDLRTPQELSKYFREKVLSEAHTLYAKT